MNHTVLKVEIKPDTDEWNIPFKITFPSGTTQQFEDGIMVECDHAGYTKGDVTAPIFNEDAHIYEPTGSQKAFVCDRCHAWSYDGEDWNE